MPSHGLTRRAFVGGATASLTVFARSLHAAASANASASLDVAASQRKTLGTRCWSLLEATTGAIS